MIQKIKQAILSIRYFFPSWVKKKFICYAAFLKYSINRKLSPQSKQKRVLGIWTIYPQHFAIGVFIEFQIRLLCMCSNSKEDTRIDIAFVNGTNSSFFHINGDKIPTDKLINDDNLAYHMNDILPTLNLNPRLGSVFYFDSTESFEAHFNKNKNTYVCSQPSFSEYLSRIEKYLMNHGNFLCIKNFFSENKYVPELNFKKVTAMWARNFIKKFVDKKFMIAVNLRLNRFSDFKRNADLKAWEALFEYSLKNDYPVIFVIIGRKNEVKDIIKEFPNVIFSKDYNTNIEQDLALIKHSLFYMGNASGPSSLAHLSSNIPYVLTQFMMPETATCSRWLKPGTNFPWTNKKIQHLLWETETGDLLIKEFKYMFENVNKELWKKRIDVEHIDETILEWPYIGMPENEQRARLKVAQDRPTSDAIAKQKIFEEINQL